MAVRTREELLEAIKARIGDATDDETLGFVEDVTDTLNDFETRSKDSTDWEQKYNDNDKQWREKYRARFFNNSTEEEDEIEEQQDKPKTFADLFKTE